MLCRATQDRWVIVKSSDKTWSTGGGNSKPLQYSCHKNPMNYMKKKKNDTRGCTPPSWKVSNMLLGRAKGKIIAPERMKRLVQSRNDAQFWICLMVKVKFSAVKNNQGKLDMVKSEMWARVNTDILGISELK